MSDADDDPLARHDDLFAMLMGSSKWNGARVAEGLRSEYLTGGARLFAVTLLADLIEGNGRWGGRKLKLSGDGNQFHAKDAKAEYDRIMQIGAWVQSEIDRGVTFRDALYGAQDELGVSDSTAQRALVIYRQRRERAEETGKWYPVPPVRKRKRSRQK